MAALDPKREESLLQIVRIWISAQYLHQQGFVTVLCAADAFVVFDRWILIGRYRGWPLKRKAAHKAIRMCNRWVGIRMRKLQMVRVRKTLQYSVQSYTHFMMAKVSAEDVANEIGLAADELSKSCNNSIIPSLADCFSEWEVIFGSLLSEIELNGVDKENTTGVKKRIAALRKWKARNGCEATYKVLVDALLNRDERDQAENLCKILADHSMSNKNGK